MGSVAGGIDGIEAVFDDASLVADAGLLLAGTVMGRLGLEALIDEVVRPPAAGRGSGAKALSVVASMLVGGRSSATRRGCAPGLLRRCCRLSLRRRRLWGRGFVRSRSAMSADSTAPVSWLWAGRGLWARRRRWRR